MRKAISQWAFPGDMPMAERMALAAKWGYQGIEIALDEDPSGSLAALGCLTVEAVETQARAIVSMAADAGLEVASVATGLHWTYPLTADDPGTRAHSLEVTERLLLAANLVGVDAVLIIPGLVGAVFIPGAAPVPYDVCYERALEAVGKLLPSAADLKVRMGLEPVWNMFLLSPLEWRRFIDAFDSPWVSCYFDVGNVLLTGYPEHWIRILGGRICRVHIKDFKRSVGTINGFCDILEGDVNFPEVMRALRDVGYDGWLTAEVFAANAYAVEHQLEITSRALDRILEM